MRKVEKNHVRRMAEGNGGCLFWALGASGWVGDARTFGSPGQDAHATWCTTPPTLQNPVRLGASWCMSPVQSPPGQSFEPRIVARMNTDNADESLLLIRAHPGNPWSRTFGIPHSPSRR